MRFFFIVASIALLLSPLSAQAAPLPLVGEIQKNYESMQSFTAQFVQKLRHQESGTEETRKGTLLFEKPLRIRWETLKPHAELLVISEKDVWDYLPDEEVAYRYSPDVVKDSNSILQVVTGQTRLDTDFTIEPEPDEKGMAVLRLYPKEPTTQLVEAVIWVDKTSKTIRKAQILDFYGNSNEVTLDKLQPNVSVSASSFTFTPPSGTDIEDLKEQKTPERQLMQ